MVQQLLLPLHLNANFVPQLRLEILPHLSELDRQLREQLGRVIHHQQRGWQTWEE